MNKKELYKKDKIELKISVHERSPDEDQEKKERCAYVINKYIKEFLAAGYRSFEIIAYKEDKKYIDE